MIGMCCCECRKPFDEDFSRVWCSFFQKYPGVNYVLVCINQTERGVLASRPCACFFAVVPEVRGFLRCVGGARVVHHVLHDRRVAPCCVFLGPAGRAQKGSRVVYFARALKLAGTLVWIITGMPVLWYWMNTGGRTTRMYDESLAVERKGDLLLAHEAWCSYLGDFVLLLCSCCC